jgi:cellulose synthase/poly-beta-1,6-N-acetylglucosamine synthase-like glycosyltransferase
VWTVDQPPLGAVTNGTPSITVGVAAYNAARTLPGLLDSLVAQQYPRDDFEIVVADNGSTDETPAIVRRYADRAPIRLVDASARRGPAVARNAVVSTARGAIVAFTDADCLTHPDWLTEIERGFADAGVGAVAGAILADPPQTSTERFCARRGILGQEHVLAHPALPYAQTANTAFRKAVFERIGRFDEELITCEDADILWRMQLETELRLVYRPDAVVWHRHRSSRRGLWKQTFGWGVGQALLYGKHRQVVRRDSLSTVLTAYRRLGGLASLSLRRLVAVKRGQAAAELLDETYLSLLFLAGIRLGRLKGSLATRTFYP